MDMQLLISLLLFTPLVIFSLFALSYASWGLVLLGYEAISGWAIMATGMLCAALGLSGIGYTSYHAAVQKKQPVAVKQTVQSADLYSTKSNKK